MKNTEKGVSMKKEERGKIDWLITIVPFALIISLLRLPIPKMGFIP